MDKDFRRILIIKPSSLGDVVHALPVLAALRERYPAAHIAWLVGSAFAPLLMGHPLLDEVISFDRGHFGRMLRSRRSLLDFLRFVRQVRLRRFDLVIDLQGLVRSGFLALASGAGRRVGFADAREMAWLFYSHSVRCPGRTRHSVERNLHLAASLGLPTGAPRFPLGLRAEESQAARRILLQAAGQPVDRFTAVIPGARWPTKRWGEARLAALIERMHHGGLPPCVLLGGPDDRELAQRILSFCCDEVIDLVGRTSLRELVALIDLAECVVCHDSGPMHIAAALGKPLVALFGPTDPASTGPYSPTARVVSVPVYCSPCRRRRCWHHSCMRHLRVETVWDAVRALSADVPSGGRYDASSQTGAPAGPL